MKKDNSWIVALVCFITLIAAAAAAGVLVGVAAQTLMRWL